MVEIIITRRRQKMFMIRWVLPFIKDRAKVARPLTDLKPAPMKSSKRHKGKNQSVKSWIRGDIQETAFQKLNAALLSSPILVGLEAVLYQTQKEKKRVIAYASRGVSKTERNCPVHS